MPFFSHHRPGWLARALTGARARILLLIVLGGSLGLGAAYRSSAAPLTPAADLAESPRLAPQATTMWNWQTMTPAPQPVFESQGTAVNGKLYAVGGFYNSATQATTITQAYDPATNTWQLKANIPEAITHAPVVVDGSTLYVLGGYLGNNPGGSINHVWKLDTLTNTWTAGPSLPAGRGGGGAAIVNRRIYFFGGATRTPNLFDDTDHADHWVLDLNLANPTWQPLADLPNPRNHMAGVALNGKIYAIGGQHKRTEEATNQAEVDVYDPTSNTWSRAADMPIPKGHTGSSTFVVSGRIMVIGGSINGGSNGIASDDVLLYDPVSNVWLKLPAIPGIRKTPVADLIGDQIIVATGGGYYQTSTTWSSAWPNTWENGATMPAAIGEAAGGIIGNKLYLVW
jgi:N-acetylneuraminic acid mutarotase